MKKARFTEEQIIGFLREQASGVTTAEVCRRHGFSEATFYKWKSKYGGLEVLEAKRLLADTMLDNVALKDLLEKNGDADGPPRGSGAFAVGASNE